MYAYIHAYTYLTYMHTPTYHTCIHLPTIHAYTYLGSGPSLQGCLHHYVSLHANQELGDVGGHTALPGGPQGTQELTSTHAVHYDRAVLRHSSAAQVIHLVKT